MRIYNNRKRKERGKKKPIGGGSHQWGLFLPSNIVHKKGLDRSLILSFLKVHFQSKDLVPYLITVVSEGCVYLFVWLLVFFGGDKSLSLK